MSLIGDDVDETDTPVPQLETRGPFSEASIVDLLKEEAAELANAKEVYIPLKGYKGTGLQVCYHLPERGKELDDIARKVQRENKETYYRNIYTAIDTMAWLCSGLYVQPEGAEEPVMLDPGDTGVPVMFDARLAEIIGMDTTETPSARAVIRRLFANNDMAIIAHAEKLNRWLQDTKADLSLEIWQLGEVQ